jgi:hypothetical protein
LCDFPGESICGAVKKLAMIFAKPNHVPTFVLDKLGLLLELLKERKKEFEAFAGRIKNKSLKRTVLSLAQECNQYAQELLSQLEMMTGNMEMYKETGGFQSNMILLEEEAILQSCQLSEKKMIVAYRTILNEPILEDNLRNLLRNQLNGLVCAFTQIKLLNASLYHHG